MNIFKNNNLYEAESVSVFSFETISPNSSYMVELTTKV